MTTDFNKNPNFNKHKNLIRSLKPCPFCGGKARVEESHRAFIDGKSTKVALVHCLKCNARTNRIPIGEYGCTSVSADAVERAIEEWNTRVAIYSDGLIEYIKDQLDEIQCKKRVDEYTQGTLDTLIDLLRFAGATENLEMKV